MIDCNKLAAAEPMRYITFTVFGNRQVTVSEKKMPDLLAVVRKTGETPLQAIERLIIEHEEGQKEPKINRHNPGKIDYYLYKYGFTYGRANHQLKKP